MKILCSLVLIAHLLFSCQSDKGPDLERQIVALEKELSQEAQPSAEKLSQLQALYEEKVNRHPGQ